MKTLILSILSVVIMSTTFAQTTSRNLEDFSSLKVNSAVEVILKQGINNKISIVGISPDDLNKINVEVSGDVLYVSTSAGIHINKGSKVIITFKNLNNIMQVGDSGNSFTNKIIVKGSGAMDADFNINVNEFTIDFSGASDIKLTGKVNVLNVKLSGASDLKSGDLIAKSVIVNISGASDATLFVDSAIVGKISGASDVHIKGNPSYRDINNSSASTIGGSCDELKIKVGKNNNLIVNDDNVDFNLGKSTVKVVDDTTNIKFFGYKLLVIDDSVSLQKKIKVEEIIWPE